VLNGTIDGDLTVFCGCEECVRFDGEMGDHWKGVDLIDYAVC
jgi:hypothetical protein